MKVSPMSDKARAIAAYRSHFFADWRLWTRKRTCTLEDEGVLVRLLDEYWMAGCDGLPSDHENLADVLGVTKEQVASVLEHTTAHHVEGARIHFDGLRKNFEKALEQSKKQSARARARWSKDNRMPRHTPPYPDPDPDPDLTPNGSTCSTSASNDTDWMNLGDFNDCDQ